MMVDKTKWGKYILKDICTFLSRGRSPKYDDNCPIYPVFAQKCNLKEGGMSLANVRFLSPDSVDKWKESYKLQHQDVLINSTGTGTVGRVGIFDISLLGNFPFIVPDSHVSVVRILETICDSRFIYYQLKGERVQKYFEDNLQGSTNQKELYISTISDTEVVLPPLPIQQSIAAELDSIQGMIAKYREQLEDYDKLAQSIFYEMFGDPVKNEKRWETKLLGDVCNKMSTGPFGSMLHKTDYVDLGTPTINPQNIIGKSITNDKLCYISEEKADELSRYVVKNKNIVLARRGDLSKCGIITPKEDGWICGTGSFFIELKEHEPLFFWYYYTSNQIQKILNDQCIGATMPNLNQTILGSLQISTPPTSLQQSFAERIEKIEAIKEQTKSQIADLQQLFDSRMQYYFK